MAEFYLDISAVGNEYQAYADTPATWGVPQDGNGKAGPGHAAAVAIATIDCNGASASGTGTVGVLGVTVSSTLNASGAALATAIVTAINASATATSATYSAALLPLNRLVFARVNPSVNTEVQIMLRIAGTDWNGFTPTRANITGGGVTAFSGGANGPFGYLVTNVTVFGKTARGYGLMTNLKVAAVTDPGTIADVIHCRTRRSGANLTVTMVESTTRYDWIITPTSANRIFLMDDGTLWTGDAGLLTVSLSVPGGVSGGFNTIQTTANTTSSVTSRTGQRFRLLVDVPVAPYGYDMRATSGSVRIWDGVIFEEAGTNAGGGFFYNQNAEGNTRWQMSNSKWIAKGARILANTSSNPGPRISYINCEFEYFGLTANVSAIVNLAAGGQNDWMFEAIGCKFFDRNGVYGITNPVTGGGSFPNAAHRVFFDGCTGITDVASGWNGAIADYGRQLVWENFGPLRDWRVESGSWLTEWRYGQNFPTLTSQLPNGDPWSIKVLLRNSMIWGVPQRPAKLPGRTRLTTATRTFTLEYLAAFAFTKSQLGMVIAYIDNNDVVRYESTLQSHAQHLIGGVAVPTGAASWTLNGQTGLTAYKLQLTTAYPVKQGTEFIVYLQVCGTLVSDQGIYINGEVDVT